MRRYLVFTIFTLFVCQPINAALTLGLLDDFEDGTVGGWSSPVMNTFNVPGGPLGSTRYLEIRPAARLAAFDDGINGIIDPSVSAIRVDLFRPLGLSPLEIRIVLFGGIGDNRWTSTTAHILPGDGLWHTMIFSILVEDLTQVFGSEPYSNLTANLNQVMIRHDAGAPSFGGTAVSPDIGAFGIDNVTAIPIPAALWLFVGALSGFVFVTHRRSA